MNLFLIVGGFIIVRNEIANIPQLRESKGSRLWVEAKVFQVCRCANSPYHLVEEARDAFKINEVKHKRIPVHILLKTNQRRP